MLETIISASISTFFTTLILWLVIRSSKNGRKPAKHYLLPWAIGVIGFSTIGILKFNSQVETEGALVAVGVIAVFMYMLVDARGLE